MRPQLNQIRAWVRQGRTDAWVAHQLEVTVQEIEQFKRQNDLGNGDAAAEGEKTTVEYPEEIDLRAEDDALIAAELEEAAREAERAQAEAKEREEAEAARRAAEGEDDKEDDGEAPEPRRRGRRGGRTRRGGRGTRQKGPLEGTFDHGEEGYGLWLDPAVQDDPIYAEHWAGHRPVEVVVEEEQIVIRRTGDDD